MIGHDYKRSSSRKSLNARVYVNTGKNERIAADAIDLSASGLSIHSEHKLQIQQIYRLEIEMKVRGSIRTIKALAEVLSCAYSRIGCFKIGMRLLEVEGGSEAVIIEYLEA